MRLWRPDLVVHGEEMSKKISRLLTKFKIRNFVWIAKFSSRWNTNSFLPVASSINKFIRYQHFKMEPLESVRYLVRRGDWLALLYLKDGYFTVAIKKSHHKYKWFRWKERVFELTGFFATTGNPTLIQLRLFWFQLSWLAVSALKCWATQTHVWVTLN